MVASGVAEVREDAVAVVTRLSTNAALGAAAFAVEETTSGPAKVEQLCATDDALSEVVDAWLT